MKNKYSTNYAITSLFADISESFKASCPKLVGLNYSHLETSFNYYRSLTLDDFEELQKLLEKSYYATNSKLNLFFAASTVPITPFPEILYSLLLNTPIICRIPEVYSLEFYEYFISKLPLEFKNYVRLMQWPSTDEETTQKIISEVDCVIVHGDDQTIETISSFSKNKNFLGFGHKASFAVCDLTKELSLKNLTKDIMTFKQAGCMSPQVIYCLNSTTKSLNSFANELSENLQQTHDSLTPVEAFIQKSLIEQALMNGCQLVGKAVIVSTDKQFDYSCGNGFIWLKQIDNLSELTDSTSKLKERIACIGNNLNTFQREPLSNMFPLARVCELGQMQLPPILYFQNPTSLI